MFRKLKVLQIFPLSLELHILSDHSAFRFLWGEHKAIICEVLVNDSFINTLREFTADYARYQEEPFCLDSSHHKWIWFYERYIPVFMHKPAEITERKKSLLFDHYGKTLMQAYVSGELKLKEEQYTSKSNLSLVVLSWNTAGLPPRGNLTDWVSCCSKKYTQAVSCPDIVIFGLQEMCELTKLLGDPVRELEWVRYLRAQVSSIYSDEYAIVHQSSLVGLMTLVMVKKSLAGLICNMAEHQVKLGLKGYAGNKGALGFRFELLGSCLCFINSHLAPHKQNFKLRNENITQISRNIKFTINNTTLSIFEHDLIFWYGDLNYRIDSLSTEKIIKNITTNNFKSCLEHDQLIKARNKEGVLSDFFEGEIDFLPTFKYLIGSNQHNVRRDPAWCDRILWRGSSYLNRYGSCDGIQVSDHKPVFAEFTLVLKKRDLNKMSMVMNDIYREIDEKHNEAAPKTEISASKVVFQPARYKIPNENSFDVNNIGKSPAHFEVIAESWVQVSHTKGIIDPGQSLHLKITLFLNARFYKTYRSKQETMEKYIKVSIKNGLEYFIELDFQVIDTFIGHSCDYLCKTTPDRENPGLPEQVVRIIEYFKNSGLKVRNLIESLPSQIQNGEVVKKIDENEAFGGSTSPFEIIQTFCEFLKNLEEPLLDGNAVDAKINIMHIVGFNIVKIQLLDPARSTNAACLNYISDYLKTLVSKSQESGVSASYLAIKLYKAVFQVENLSKEKKKQRISFLEQLFQPEF